MQEENLTKQDGNLDQPNVNESLALAGLFRKVLTKDRVPENGLKSYCTNSGIFIYNGDWHCINPHGIQWWLEEVEFPSDIDIQDEATERYIDVRHSRANSFIEGANWMRSLAVTAKDNVR